MDATLRLAFGIILCIGFGMLISLLLQGKADSQSAPNVLRVVAGTMTLQIGTLLLFWRFLREHGLSWAQAFGLGRNLSRVLTVACVVAAITLPIIWTIQAVGLRLLSILGIDPGEQLALLALRQSASVPEIILMGIMTVGLAPVVEEVLFRGLFYPFLKHLGWPRVALWGSSVCFALVHFNLGVFVPLLVLALILVWLYEKTGNLLAPIGVHLIFNAVNFTLFFFLESGHDQLPGHS